MLSRGTTLGPMCSLECKLDSVLGSEQEEGTANQEDVLQYKTKVLPLLWREP